jgi:hypothetical protein
VTVTDAGCVGLAAVNEKPLVLPGWFGVNDTDNVGPVAAWGTSAARLACGAAAPEAYATAMVSIATAVATVASQRLDREDINEAP